MAFMYRIFLTVTLLLGGLFIVATTHAQDSGIVTISWQAETTAPRTYKGRVMPALNTPITVSATVIDGGRALSPSGLSYTWKMGNKTIDSGTGVSSVTFTQARLTRSPARIEVTITGNGTTYSESITIPLVRPEVVVVAPFPFSLIPSDTVRFTAEPYFFPRGERISYEWLVNGSRTYEDTNTLSVDLGGGTTGSDIYVSAQAQTASLLNGSWFSAFTLR